MTHAVRGFADTLYLRWATLLDNPDGGFTVKLPTGKMPTSGYAVATHPHLSRQLVGPVDPRHIRSYVLENNEVLRLDGSYLGGWRDPETGVAYLDVVTVTDNREQALRVARDLGELAVWGFAEGKSIRV